MKACLVSERAGSFLTQDVDVNGGGGSTAAVGGLNDVGGTVISIGLCNGDSGMSWFRVNGDSVIWLEDQVGLCPLYPRFRLPLHLCRQLNLAASFSCQTSQQFGIQLNLWRLYMHDTNTKTKTVRNLQSKNINSFLKAAFQKASYGFRRTLAHLWDQQPGFHQWPCRAGWHQVCSRLGLCRNTTHPR